jgi:hypothetical protein
MDGDVIEAVDGMPILDGFGQLGLAAAEIADDITAALSAPADHFFIGHDRPILAGFSIQRVVLFPFLRVGVKASVCAVAPAVLLRVACEVMTKENAAYHQEGGHETGLLATFFVPDQVMFPFPDSSWQLT